MQRVPLTGSAMGLYDRYVLPRLIGFACSREANMKQRERVVPRARGVVLEIGIGTGLNLPFYDADRVSRVLGLEPAPEMIRLARKAARSVDVPVELVEGPGEAIPLGPASVDTVVITYTLCSIPDAPRAVGEMARVLKPGGRLLFCEHGAAPDPGVLGWQRRLTPIWKRIGGGCHLDRDIPALLAAGGFGAGEVEQGYIPGWRPASYNYWGAASRVG